MPKRAWVISGGGARIVQALALIEAHLEKGAPWPNVIIGTSAGGLLAFLLCKQGIDLARKEILTIRRRADVFEGQFFWGLFNLGLWHSAPLQRLMHRVNYSSYGFKTEGYVCSYNIDTFKTVYLKFGQMDARLFASTACIPILVDPLNSLVDGGLTENTPLQFPIDLGADKIDVFMCSAEDKINTSSRVSSKIDFALRCFEAMRIEIAKDDLKVAAEKNGKPQKRTIDVTLHTPKTNIISVLDFNRINEAYARRREVV